MFANNIEPLFPFIGENIQGVLFHDMGNVYTKLGNISFRFRFGDGIRYRTPVGPIRADFAYSINPPNLVLKQTTGCGK